MASDKTSFIVGPSLSDVSGSDQKQVAIDRMKKMPYHDFQLNEDSIAEVIIDGVSGYEMVGEGISNSTGVKEMVYQVMLFTDSGYYLMIGIAQDEFNRNLTLFKQVAESWRRK